MNPPRVLGAVSALGVLVGVATGMASALFLWLLDIATQVRQGHRALVYALPFVGLVMGLAYERFGRPVQSGNNLIIDRLRQDGPAIPSRMAPMVLVGTVVTHLFGGSAGREGTAVQMGAGLASALAAPFQLSWALRQGILSAGVAGGFGAVFGTPLAGAVFAVEFVARGRLFHATLWPALVAALAGDMTTRALGIAHTPYPQVAALVLTPGIMARWIVFGAAVAVVAVVFIELIQAIKLFLAAKIVRLRFRMFLGGLAVLMLWQIGGLVLPDGADAYLGLGIPTLVRSFHDPNLPIYAFAIKVLFTVVTVGSGFIGGEVTPLFFTGAALGNGLGTALGLPLSLSAGVGMASLFGAAAQVPLALIIMAVELLGASVLPHVAIVALVAHVIVGQRSIYAAQIDRAL